MTVLFPSEPFEPRDVDSSFAEELRAARAAGLKAHLVDHSRVTAGDAAGATALVPEGAQHAVYRGWMLTPEQYRSMYTALSARSVRLLNSPEAYRTCHHLPESYAFIEGHTPKSTWAPLKGPPSREFLRDLASPFGSGPIVIKDYVKSQKHYWNEACFIADASNVSDVERVVARFLELQGDGLEGGLVFREFAPLRIVGNHPKSGMPLAAEFRIFWLDGEPLWTHRYWADLVAYEASVPLAELAPIAAKVPSRFFTMDVALCDDDRWAIVELGDAQVSGLPSDDLADDFYRALSDRWPGAREG